MTPCLPRLGPIPVCQIALLHPIYCHKKYSNTCQSTVPKYGKNMLGPNRGWNEDLGTGRVGIELPPVASMLMQSLRSVGYSTAAALADLIDNSITAKASTVRISVAMTPRPFVAVTDDGCGMDEATLQS